MKFEISTMMLRLVKLTSFVKPWGEVQVGWRMERRSRRSLLGAQRRRHRWSYRDVEKVVNPETGETTERPLMMSSVSSNAWSDDGGSRTRWSKLWSHRDRRRTCRVLTEQAFGRNLARRTRAYLDRQREFRANDEQTCCRCLQAKDRQVSKSHRLQLGYESRCAQPHAFDVMLGSQIGVGAFRALVEKKLNES